jgi:hypothetical protein
MTTTEPQPEPVRLARRRALVEDAEWMAATGETMPGAAARLRLHPHTLRDRLKKAGRPDLWARLVANADPGYPVAGTIRATGTWRAA